MAMIGASPAAIRLPSWRAERVLFTSQDFLVVDKPAGIPVYGGDEALDHSCVARLGRFLASGAQGDVAPQLGVHQRLDQCTSGVLFFTLSQAVNAQVAQAMGAHTIERRYHAVVEMAPRDALRDGRVELWLRHVRGKTEVVKPSVSLAKKATTELEIVRRVGRRALVSCRLQSGRTHQIRATLAHLGAPILGDRLYGGAPAARVFLHAVRLSGAPLPREFVSDAPLEFEFALQGKVPPWSTARLVEAVGDAASLRAPLQRQSDSFRLVNGEGDGIAGLTVDAYGSAATVNFYEPGLLQHSAALFQVLHQLGYASLYVKRRVRADLRRQDAQVLAPNEPASGPPAEGEAEVIENGMRFGIDLHDGLSTGLFVDMRDNRARVRKWAGEATQATLLNLFCYTCSFSVAAALGGATTTSVDLSAKALERGRANFARNGIDCEAHRFIKDDAMKFLRREVRRGKRYHLIVLDPPSFSTVRGGTFSVKGRYQEAASDCLRLLEPGGRLLCVTNHQKTSLRAMLEMVEQAAFRAQRQIESRQVLKSGLDCPDAALGPFPSKSLLVQVR